MTRAFLMANTVQAAEKTLDIFRLFSFTFK